MDTLFKKEYEEFLIIIDFEDRFEILETIASFSVVCVNLCTGIDESASLIFFEDSVYQATDVAYGEGRYGGIPDNLSFLTVFGIKNGILGNKYKITVKATTNLGNLYEEDIVLEVIERIDGYMQKQPSEKFSILMDFTNRLNNVDARYDDIISTQSITVIRKSDGVDVTGSIVFGSALEGAEKVKVGVQGGSNTEDYQMVNKIVSVGGYKYQVDALLSVDEK
ncbi:MAG: hypothetical protein NUV76_12190 [Candidatus Kuenenia sp.]|nr:hypothetical protein [Candidatus Kuenenia sp.]